MSNKEEAATSIYLLDMQISVIIILGQVYMVWKVCKDPRELPLNTNILPLKSSQSIFAEGIMSQFLPSPHNILKSNQGLQSFLLISNVKLGGIYNSSLLFFCFALFFFFQSFWKMTLKEMSCCIKCIFKKPMTSSLWAQIKSQALQAVSSVLYTLLGLTVLYQFGIDFVVKTKKEISMLTKLSLYVL